MIMQTETLDYYFLDDELYYENQELWKKLESIFDSLNERYKPLFKTFLDFYSDYQDFIDNFDIQDFILWDASDIFELGCTLVENGYFEVPDYLEMYFDYEALGRNYTYTNTGVFEDCYYVEHVY